MKATCPCCGYRTLVRPRNWELCDLCFWEDDPLQSYNPDFASGTNEKSLRDYQSDFMNGVYPHREPSFFDEKDPLWIPFQEVIEA